MTTKLCLKKHEDRRLRGGHVWVFSNEVDVQKTPLTEFTPGQQVVVESYSGKPLGSAYVNPRSLICARIISRQPDVVLDKALLVTRLRRALALREQVFSQPFYRLVFAESDELPGLVVDRYNDVLVAQVNTAGMESVTDEIRMALEEVLQPKAILLRNDTSIREVEGLARSVEPLLGEPPQLVPVIENGTHFMAPIWQGQKTGWFYDHRFNRARLKDYVANKRVLDVFSYSGAWGIQAAVYGAAEVHCIDSSAQALEWLLENAKLNHCENKIKTLKQDAFTALTELNQANEKYDVIILDPPAFIKRRKDAKEGLNAYRRLNQQALRLLKPDGILISASCSLHLPSENLVELLAVAGSYADHHLQILEQGHQSPDHPVHPAIPETNYLKTFICRAS